MGGFGFGFGFGAGFGLGFGFGAGFFTGFLGAFFATGFLAAFFAAFFAGLAAFFLVFLIATSDSPFGTCARIRLTHSRPNMFGHQEKSAWRRWNLSNNHCQRARAHAVDKDSPRVLP